MKKISTTLIFFLFSTFSIVAQNGIIKGKVFNPISNEAIPFANVVIQGTTTGTSTDIDGNYIISGLEPKLYRDLIGKKMLKPSSINTPVTMDHIN